MDNMKTNALSEWFCKDPYMVLRGDIEDFFCEARQFKDSLKVIYVFMAMASSLVEYFSSLDESYFPSMISSEIDKSASALNDKYTRIKEEFGQDMGVLEAIGSNGKGLVSRCDEVEESLRLLEKEIAPIVKRYSKKAIHEL